MKVERVSYDVMTPSAARGVLEAIHWKPSIRWVIDRIHVLRPIRFENIRRNEVGAKASHRNAMAAQRSGDLSTLGIDVTAERQQRAMMAHDIDYDAGRASRFFRAVMEDGVIDVAGAIARDGLAS